MSRLRSTWKKGIGGPWRFPWLIEMSLYPGFRVVALGGSLSAFHPGSLYIFTLLLLGRTRAIGAFALIRTLHRMALAAVFPSPLTYLVAGVDTIVARCEMLQLPTRHLFLPWALGLTGMGASRKISVGIIFISGSLFRFHGDFEPR